MNQKLNDISDFFKILNKNRITLIFSLLFFFLISLYFSINQIDGERKNYIIELDLSELLLETNNKINQYAKRQDTWFRNKYESDYIIRDIERNLRKNCTDILSLYNSM